MNRSIQTARLPLRTFIATATSAPLNLALTLVCAAALSACGGGSTTTSTNTTPPVVVDPLAPALATDMEKAMALYGIDASGVGGDGGGDGGAAGAAGDGAPLKRAVVTLTDAKGNQVNGLTDDNGKFLLKYKTANFTAPLVLRVVDAGGNILTSVTDESAAIGKVIRASINPLTDKITSDVIPASISGTDKAFDGSKVDLTKLVKAKSDVVTSINAALGTAGVADTSKFDAVKSVYSSDGTGVDAVIESISHARDANTGATQLRAKLVALATNTDGTVSPTLITASTPLDTASVAISSNPGLTFAKLNAFVTEFNRCIALTSAARITDGCGTDNRFVSPKFKNSSKDFDETYRTLQSESDRSAVQGSTLRNPLILFTSRSTGSSVDDAAVVEFTVNQPRTGPLAGNSAIPIEYTTTVVFRRDDTLTNAIAKNWIVYGNQRTYNVSPQTRYIKTLQINPLQQANVSGKSPSTLTSSLHINFQTQKFDIATRTYVPANVRAVRVKGPGYPATGVVYAPSTVPGSEANLTIFNKTGVVGTTTLANNFTSNAFVLGATALDGTALYSGWWPTATVNYSDTPLTDYSALQAYSQYTFEIFLTTNTSSTVPDAVETARNLSPLMQPNTITGMQTMDFSPSVPLVTAPAAGGCTFNIAWTNNVNASPVSNAFIYGQQLGVTPNVKTTINTSVNASTIGVRPTSATATATNCSTGAIPALGSVINGGDFRQVGIGSVQSRAQIYTYMNWNN